MKNTLIKNRLHLTLLKNTTWYSLLAAKRTNNIELLEKAEMLIYDIDMSIAKIDDLLKELNN